MKGSCKSLVELEFFLEEVYKATTDQLDWNNPEGQQYLHDLLKPLPLIPNSRERRVIPFDHFINNDQLQRPRQQIMDTLNGLKTWYLEQCGVKYRLAMKNMIFGESHIGGANVNSFIDLQSIGNLLEMSTPNVESSLSQSFKSSNGIATSIWIGSLLDLNNLSLKDPRTISCIGSINNTVRHKYSNPMIQPEPEGSTQGYPLVTVEVLRSILTDSQVTPTKHGRMTKPYLSPHFLANYFNAVYLKMEVKRRSVKVKDLQEICIMKAFQVIKSRKDLSTAYHHQTDGHSERTIQTLEDMLRGCALDFGGN
nr:putative reverse transcriptase domain-containing protein [Tanacetum cinerariifolium]